VIKLKKNKLHNDILHNDDDDSNNNNNNNVHRLALCKCSIKWYLVKPILGSFVDY